MSKRNQVQVAFGLVFGGLMIAVAIVQFDAAHEKSLESTAELAADSYLRAIDAVRDVYTSEVVSRLPDSIDVTYDYQLHDHAVPPPATFTILLAEKLGATVEGLTVRLYSDYPFPTRGVPAMDEFERRALEVLTANPDTAISQFQGTGDDKVLRYARGDPMRPECVSCHNTHPESPKTDWQVGDLRGVLEITLPLSTFEASASEARQPYVLLLSMALIGLLAAVVILADHLPSLPGARRRRRAVPSRAAAAKSEAA